MNILAESRSIRALSVAGPFPWRIAHGHKQIELRSWATSHSGIIILLHASSGSGWEHLFEPFGLSRKDCPKFSIVGAARLKTCVQYNSEKLWEAHRDRHCWVGNDTYLEVLSQYGGYPYGHIMEDAIAFDQPILDVPGARNYWLPKNERQKVGFEKAIKLLKATGFLS
jgi:hypothetical protein